MLTDSAEFDLWLKTLEQSRPLDKDQKVCHEVAEKLTNLLKGPMSKGMFDPRAPYRLHLFHWLREHQSWSAELLEREYERAKAQPAGTWLANYPSPDNAEEFHNADKTELTALLNTCLYNEMRKRAMLSHADWLQTTCEPRQMPIKAAFLRLAREALRQNSEPASDGDDGKQGYFLLEGHGILNARPRAKGLETMLEKITTSLSEGDDCHEANMSALKTAANLISDINGVTIVLKDAADVKALCESLRQKTWQEDGVWVISTYNAFHSSSSKAQYREGGYRDLKMSILLDLSKFNLETNAPHLLVELQVHLFTFYRLKEPQMHLAYEFVQGSADWPSNATQCGYPGLLKIWNSFQKDLHALQHVRRSVHEIAGRRVSREEFVALLQERWSWWDSQGHKLEPSQLTGDHLNLIAWFWELALAGDDTESGSSESAAQVCPSPSVGTWLTPLLVSSAPSVKTQRLQYAGSFEKKYDPVLGIPIQPTPVESLEYSQSLLRATVDYKRFCEEFFGVDLLYSGDDEHGGSDVPPASVPKEAEATICTAA
eukprot:gnl/MRDRNA2_/MRDRNA2_34141_c0_seq1.p1 gnl/MRDRNA2_/MRDRNA2_34141_c0~~gnl/MRDRNA2_/MRDRNA2_34141_c0_seq1.p1  ORF type:complete len:579 (-),score=106.46 gnl/MRDRNA2_/MRDRNA2_34141_c0_seq1:36-1664(-)